MGIRVIFFVFVSVCLFLSGSTYASPPAMKSPAVIDFGPRDMQRDVRQVYLRFSEDMMALGDNRADDAATIQCIGTNAKPKGRWLDARRWVGEFEHALNDGVRCKVTPRKIRNLKGRPAAMPAAWSFDTGGPRVKEIIPYDSYGASSVTEDSATAFLPSAPVDTSSLRYLTCSVNGNPMPVQILQAEERTKEFAELWRRQHRWSPEPDKNPSWIVARCGKPVWPNDANVNWNWGKDIATPGGVKGEKNKIFNLKVRPAFTVDLTCRSMPHSDGCDSRIPIKVHFTSDVRSSEAKAFSLRGADGKVYRLNELAEQSPQSYWSFAGPFNEGDILKPEMSATVHDVDGRALQRDSSTVHLLEADAGGTEDKHNVSEIPIAHLPPYIGMVQRRGILKWRPGETVSWPVATRNTESSIQVNLWQFGAGEGSTPALLALHEQGDWGPSSLDIFNSGYRGKPFAASSTLLANLPGKPLQKIQREIHPQTRATAFTDIPLSGYGTWLIEADSKAYRDAFPFPDSGLGMNVDRWDEVASAFTNSRLSIVQVTDIDISARLSKKGASLIWLTSLSSGKPLSGAAVEIWSCERKKLVEAESDGEGRAQFDHIDIPEKCRSEEEGGRSWIVARKGKDVAILSVRDEGSFSHHKSRRSDRAFVHTILDRMLFKAGETISMQHLMRLPSAAGWAFPEKGNQGRLRIFYDWDESVFEQGIRWSADGSAESQWKIPANAKLGVYHFQVLDEDGKILDDQRFRVEEFRSPVFDASLEGSTDWRGANQVLRLKEGLTFFAGGPAAGETVLIKGGYTGSVHHSLADGYTFHDEELPEFSAPAFPERQVKLGKNGEALSELPAPQLDRAATLLAEMQFRDASGETQTQSVEVPVWPHPVKLGLRVENVKPGLLDISVVAFDEKNQPASGHQVTIDVVEADQVWKNGWRRAVALPERETICTVSTDAKGRAHCEVSWQRETKHGGWILRGQTKDAQTVSQFFDKPHVTWSRSKDPIELADDAAVKAGDTARLKIHAPFLPATFLLTVEREGVFDSRVYFLNKEEEVIDLPTQAHYAPAVQIVGRFVQAMPEKRVNSEYALPMAKEFGMQLIFDPATNRLQTRIIPQAPVVKPGSVVRTKLEVLRERDGKPVPGARITVVAVDQALLALQVNPTWAVLDAYWVPRTIDVRGAQFDAKLFHAFELDNVSEYIPLVEKRMIDPDEWQSVVTTGMRASGSAPLNRRDGAEAAKQALSRSNFSSLAIWKSDVVADERGQAEVDIPMPDSLTQWRIVAIATKGTDLFGTDETTVQTALPIQIISGLPQTVRSGDAFAQKVTVRNAGSAQRKVQLRISATPDISDAFSGGQSVPERELARPGLEFEKTIDLAGGENRTIEWPVSIPEGVTRLVWKMQATAVDGNDADAIEVAQKIVPAVPITVRDSTLLHIDRPRHLALMKPQGSLPARGGILVRWQGSLANAAIAGAQEWMRDYPYSCLEQRASKAAVSGDLAQWNEVISLLPRYLDENGLARYFPDSTLSGSDILTAYLLDIAEAYRLPIPEFERSRMRQGLREVLNREIGGDWTPSGFRLPYRLSLQAALGNQLGDVKPTVPEDLNELPVIALLDWVRYLRTTPDTPQRKKQLEEAVMQLRNRFDMHGTRLTWRDDGAVHGWWLMWSDDVQTARVVLLGYEWLRDDPRWKDDLPLLASGLADQQRHGHWSTTTGNAWGVAALRRFAESAETKPVAGKSDAFFDGRTQTAAWPQPDEMKWQWPDRGGRGMLRLLHQGDGAPWATVSTLAAMNARAPIGHGLTVHKTIAPVEQRVAGKWSEGDVMKVTLEMTSESDLGWVVVNDPIPSGATILGKSLSRESKLAQEKAGSDWWWRPSFAELASDSYRGYYARIWRGSWQAEYLVRLNNTGSFSLPPTRVEAMYAPEIFAEAPNTKVEVGP